mmetsp:Transcript_4062/g.16357  ORF Transcript_4062/g.16357 Transcript_4062/m.16357 type:complete len:234 (-) Transcript_4062:802-1503(-)
MQLGDVIPQRSPRVREVRDRLEDVDRRLLDVGDADHLEQELACVAEERLDLEVRVDLLELLDLLERRDERLDLAADHRRVRLVLVERGGLFRQRREPPREILVAFDARQRLVAGEVVRELGHAVDDLFLAKRPLLGFRVEERLEHLLELVLELRSFEQQRHGRRRRREQRLRRRVGGRRAVEQAPPERDVRAAHGVEELAHVVEQALFGEVALGEHRVELVQRRLDHLLVRRG